MNYHSDLLATRWLLWLNSAAVDPEVRAAVQKGATEESTSEERAVFYRFGLFHAVRHLWMLLALAFVVWALEWFVVPVAFQPQFEFVLPMLMFFLPFFALMSVKGYRKKKASEAGQLVVLTGEERWNTFFLSLLLGMFLLTVGDIAGFHLAHHFHL